MFCSLIEFMIEREENKRSLDDFASIFLFYAKVFKILQHRIGSTSKPRCLLTKEVAWALHSNQKVFN